MKTLAALVVVLIVFQEAVTRFFGDFFSYFDETLVLITIAILVLRILLNYKASPLALGVLAVFVYLIVVSLLFGRNKQAFQVLLQSAIHLKFFFFYILLRIIFADSEQRVVYAFNVALVISLIGLVASVVLGPSMYDFFKVPLQERGGIVRAQGLQLKPNDLGIHLGVAYICLLARYVSIKSKAFLASLTVFAVLVIYLNGSRVALAAIPLGLIGVWISRPNWRGVIALIVVAGGGLLMSLDYFWYLVEETLRNFGELNSIMDSYYIRGIMLYNSWVLMVQYFPIGSGAATFGSILSENSIVYQELNLNRLPFFEKMEGVFDSNLATVAGEFGLIGLVLFFLLHKKLLNNSLNISAQPGNRSYLYLLTVFAIIVIIANPFYMYQYNGLVFSLGYLYIARCSSAVTKAAR